MELDLRKKRGGGGIFMLFWLLTDKSYGTETENGLRTKAWKLELDFGFGIWAIFERKSLSEFGQKNWPEMAKLKIIKNWVENWQKCFRFINY